MNWINELDKHGYNFLVDELVWHLEQGRIPIAIAKVSGHDAVGYEFRFENEKPHFLKVSPEMLDKHWVEAQQIMSEFVQLQGVEYVAS